jgi:hypothetical protein
MKTPTMLFGLLSFLLMFSGAMSAQELAAAFGPSGAQGPMVKVAETVQGPDVGLIAIEPLEVGRPVKDAPYSAEAITETAQAFADGNRIEQRTSATIARDSSGRVRRQQQAVIFGGLVANSQIPLVTIVDPAGVHLTLDPERRVAYRVKTPPFPVQGNFEAAVPATVNGARERGGRVRLSVGGQPPEPDGRQRAEARFAVPGAALAKPAPLDPPEIRTEPLGEREIEGVRAEGRRTTMTIRAGAIGNHLPIVIVSERWYSPELQVVVLTRRADPRFGETVYRLVNILRAEPPADLFEVPTDYRIEEQTLKPPPSAPVPRKN